MSKEIHDLNFGTATHSFNIGHARDYGLVEAVLITNFQFWIAKNKANGRHEHDGRTWTYNSIAALTKLFSYLKAGQIRRALDSLIEQGVLRTGNYNVSGYDRTLWYAFEDEVIFIDRQFDLSKTANGNVENGKSQIQIQTNSDHFSLENGDSAVGKRKSGTKMSNTQFIDSLRPLFPGLDLDEQVRNMQAWLLTPRGKGRKMTRNFVVNWLNRQDAPMRNEANTKRKTITKENAI